MDDPFAQYGGQAHATTAPPPDPFAAYGGAQHGTQAYQSVASDRIADSLENATISPPESGITAMLDRAYNRVRDFIGADHKPAGDVLGGAALGPIRTIKGVTQLPDHPVRAVNNIVGGIGQTVALPAAVVSPATMAYAAPAIAAQTGVQEGLTKLGVDPDYAELGGNVAGIGAGVGTSAALKPKVPRSALSKTIKPADPVAFHAAEQSAIPQVNAAAKELGQPIKTADDALSALRLAKQKRLLEAHESAGAEKTIADLPADQVDALQKDMGALDTLKQHIEDAQKAASAKAPKPVPTAGGAVADLVGVASPRAAHAMNLAGKVSDAFSLLKGKNALTPASLDSSIESTFGAVEPAPSKTINMTAAAEKAPYKPAEGDLSVKHEGNIQPPETPHGDATVSPEGAKPQDTPAETEQKTAPNVRGAQLDPAGYLTLHGAEDGETAALMQLAHTGGQALRNIAKARGLKIPASADNVQIIQKIHDDLSPQEISAFNDAAQGKNAERVASLENTDSQIVADNKEIAQKLYSKADEMKANGESPYRIRAWRTAAENIETRPTSVKDILDDTEALRQIKGVDSRMAQHIQEVMQGKQPQVEPQEPSPSAPQLERRTNPDFRAAVNAMSPEDQVKAIYQDDITGAPNRRAFEWAEQHYGPAKSVAMTDADGLKAFNDKYGHEAGDAMLQAKTKALKEAGLEFYRGGKTGDEFLARGTSDADLGEKLEKAREILQNSVIRVKDEQGNSHDFIGADFSHGSGADLKTAEQNMYKMKQTRKASGDAPERGQFGKIKEIKK